MPPEFDRKWATINTRFPLPTLRRAGYSVKLIKITYVRLYPRWKRQLRHRKLPKKHEIIKKKIK